MIHALKISRAVDGDTKDTCRKKRIMRVKELRILGKNVLESWIVADLSRRGKVGGSFETQLKF